MIIKSVCANCANRNDCKDKKWYDKEGQTCLYCLRQENKQHKHRQRGEGMRRTI